MNTDPWGIDRGFFDVNKVWHETSDSTRAAILAAMGATEGADEPALAADVKVVTHGASAPLARLAIVELEDGTRLPATDRLPSDLPIGYHQLRDCVDDSLTHLIVSPLKCVLPTRERGWGWAVQLYAARSRTSWGIGDLGDLARLGRWSAGLGASLVMLNPLFSASPVIPQEPSPYYPATRRFLNPIYLRIEDVRGATELRRDLKSLAAAGRALDQQRRIDRDAVFRLKHEALSILWNARRGVSDAEFEQFRQSRGGDLRRFGIYCTLAEQYGGDWRAWPPEYQSHDSAVVDAWAKDHEDRVLYHEWLQYLLDAQLARAASTIPLVQDLPIGFDPGGFDGWIWQHMLARGCTVGAPPDIYNSAGQNWGFPPLVPHKLREAGYRPLAETLRSAFRHAGGLRIDHVMGLFRLFWIPPLASPVEGAFVRYRALETLAVLAVESHRAGAYVVGEDLGTVEEGVRETLAAHNVLSTRVLLFEDEPPDEYPQLAMVAVSTHDLPTIAGLWTGADLEAQRSIGLGPSEDAYGALTARLARLTGCKPSARVYDVIRRTYARLAEAPSMIVMAQLDDALAVLERPNMPGTRIEWPNWCLALERGIEGLERSRVANGIARALAGRS